MKDELNSGFIKFNRNYDRTIHSFPLAFNLLAVIAQRAKWRESFNNLKLEPGEALIGDYKNYGMTRQQYRTCLIFLKSTNQITTRTTNKGTIAKLVSSAIFDINLETSNHPNSQPTNQTATNEQPLTKKDKKEKKESNKKQVSKPDPETPSLEENGSPVPAASQGLTPHQQEDAWEVAEKLSERKIEQERKANVK